MSATATAPTSALAQHKKDTVDVVAENVQRYVQNGDLKLPPNYSPENAMKAAWLVLQETQTRDKRPVLEVCSKPSIVNSLLDMVVQGLNPGKKQCYFIAYGPKLVCMRSYFGSMALVKRVLPKADIWFACIYKGDTFEYTLDRGRVAIGKHTQQLENVKPENIIAAYCCIDPGNGQPVHTEVMTIDQIRAAWSQGQQYSEHPDKPGVHQKFTDQMAQKTVINRACKAVINSSSDDYLLLHHMNRSDDAVAEGAIEAEAEEAGNGQPLDLSEPVAPSQAPAAAEPAPPPAAASNGAPRQTRLTDEPPF